jgi:hypothetical protein
VGVGVRGGGTRRRLTVITVLGLGLTLAGTPAASAQGEPVGGWGAAYFLAGAGNTTGWASSAYTYGDPWDVVYFGDFVDASGAFGSDGRDEPMVRRGSTFIIRGAEWRPFVYGDPGDTVLVGDWDGDGTDTVGAKSMTGPTWSLSNSNTTPTVSLTLDFGLANDLPLTWR